MRNVFVGLLLAAVVAPVEVAAQEAPPPPPDDWAGIAAPPLVEPAPLASDEVPPLPEESGQPPAPTGDFGLPPPAGDLGVPPPAPAADFGVPAPAPAAELPPPPAFAPAPSPGSAAVGAVPGVAAAVPPPSHRHSPATGDLSLEDPGTTRLASSPGGPVGLSRVLAAEPGPVGTFRIGLHGQFFDSAGFPVQETENQRVGGTWTLAWTPIRALDVYAAYSMSSNRNDGGSPPLIQSQGDTWFGGKSGFLATEGLWLGADLRLALYPAIGDQRASAVGFLPTGLLTWDVHRVSPSVPLRLHLNVGGQFDGTRELSDSALTAAERYALHVNEYDRLALAAGLEAPLPYVTPFVEFGTELPLGAPGELEQTDGELIATSDAAPRRATLGARITAIEDLSILVAADIGLQRHVVEGIPATPPWDLTFGLAYTLDPFAKERVQVVERVVPAPAAAVVAATGKVVGVVLDAATREPVPGAVVALATPASPGLPPVASDAAAGRFLSHELPPGPVDVTVTKDGYGAATLAVLVEAGRETPAEILLSRDAAKPASLVVRVRGPGGPLDAEVTVDGPESTRIALSNGEGQAELPAGRYRVKVVARGFLSREGTAEVADHAPTTLQFELSPRPKNTGLVFTGNKILPKRTIRFRGDTAVILPSSFSYLDEVAAAIVDHGYRKLRIDGHVSNTYGDRALALSAQRAKAVRAYLVDKAGVDPDKLEVRGWGDTNPIAPNLTDLGRKMNTRVTFTIRRR